MIISVLVTGANGQLGKCFRDIAAGSSPKIRWTFMSSNEMDITNEAEVANVFNNDSFHFLVNCAAYTAVDKAEEEISKAYQINAEAVKVLAENCKKHQTTFIHISTDFVFDGTKKTPYEITDKVNPLNVYGQSKLKGEEYIRELLDNYYIIRTSWVYSIYGGNFVKTMLKLGDNRKEIGVVNDQIGAPTYAPDLAKFIVDIIAFPDYFGIYHYCNKGKISWYDFAKTIFRITDKTIKIEPVPTESYPTPAKRPKFSLLSTLETEKTFQVSIPNWDESLKKMLVE
ncbi:dTDP-4-dehydrorhamnose reductase [Aquimarina algiphila]|uniref:dTDP-4-dehydrorhamnose reductase n=1 Tax=Aquimarina algiphila TaxID=2047982 RepID=UPI00232D69CB|nr:dTDP-4-dehydrorhamnose reductase [Aquimarina algiphila]